MKRQNIEIIKMYGILGERTFQGKHQTLELNLVKWKGSNKPQWDIRWWQDDTPTYGISLTDHMLAELGEMIPVVFKEESTK